MHHPEYAVVLSCAALLAAASGAPAQSSHPSIFVGNNGNLEGSMSSLRIEPDGTLTLIDKLITGLDDEPGTNAQTIALSPDGRWLCTGHGTASTTVEQLTIAEVLSDGTLTLVEIFQTIDSPLDVQWISDAYLAVTHTSVSGSNEVLVYDFDPAGPSLTQIDADSTGGFNTHLAVDRANGHLFAQDSTFNQVFSFAIQPDGTLDLIQSLGTGSTFPLGIGLSPDGSKLYAGGGISSGGDKILGINVNVATGAMNPMPGSPYLSPGDSPKQVAVSGNGAFALVAHGGDASIHVYAIDDESGDLTYTGFSYDVGFQGTLGEVVGFGDLVFVTDNSTIIDGVRGVRSLTLGPDGSLSENGTIVETGGIGPDEIAVWRPAACAGDLDGNGFVDVDDLLALLGSWGSCPGCPADLDGDGAVDVDDLLALLAAWGPC